MRLSGSALVTTGIGLAVMGLVGGPLGLVVGTAAFAVGIAFMFPALLAVAVARVDEGERGAVVGTTSAFLDLSFGLAPASSDWWSVTAATARPSSCPASIALAGALALFLVRDSLRPPGREVAGVPTLAR